MSELKLNYTKKLAYIVQNVNYEVASNPRMMIKYFAEDYLVLHAEVERLQAELKKAMAEIEHEMYSGHSDEDSGSVDSGWRWGAEKCYDIIHKYFPELKDKQEAKWVN